MSAPGKPHDPTVHQSRTRPEATDFAVKNRLTNDWFRHDATTMKVPSLAGDCHRPLSTGEWMTSEPVAPRRGPSRQVQATHDKVYGHQETWFKHDDNRHYVDPVRADRGSADAVQVKAKMADASKHTMDWYRQDNASHAITTPDNQKHRLIGQIAQDIGQKLQIKAGAPDWFEHNTEQQQLDQRRLRLTMKEAIDNCERDRAGCMASDWTDEYNELQQPHFRVTSKQGQLIAAKLSSESEHWFEHNEHADKTDKRTRPRSELMKTIVEKHQGTDMKQILACNENKNDTGLRLDLNSSKRNVSLEAQQFAVRSQQGTINTVLDQTTNKDYQLPVRCPRAIKPEAMATFEKNKGCMEECLQGYLPPPLSHELHRARPADRALVDKYSGQAMKKTLKGELPAAGHAHHARAVKPEAESYAERNRGTVGQVLTDVGRPASVTVAGCKGLRTEAAQEIAHRYQHGSVGQLLC